MLSSLNLCVSSFALFDCKRTINETDMKRLIRRLSGISSAHIRVIRDTVHCSSDIVDYCLSSWALYFEPAGECTCRYSKIGQRHLVSVYPCELPAQIRRQELQCSFLESDRFTLMTTLKKCHFSTGESFHYILFRTCNESLLIKYLLRVNKS
jgi:hypothetical protein